MAASAAMRAVRQALEALSDEEDDNASTTKNKKVYAPTVVREGDKIIVPEGTDLAQVIDSLKRKHSAEQQTMAIHVTIPVPPWDGAIALFRAIEEELGVAIQKENWFGQADQIEIEVDLGVTMTVPWGQFELPAMEGATVHTDTSFENNRIVFACHVSCKRKYEGRVRRLLDKVRVMATTQSLHKGKAFSIAFKDSQGNQEFLPKPRFFAFGGDAPIFTLELEAAIERNIFVPLQQSDNLVKIGESLKRGALFAGAYGVGKTMLANHIARVATASGWTFIYVKDSAELPQALLYAEAYQPVVVFAEDIDRIAGATRDKNVNELLNQLDGIDSKVASIMTILTTNFPESVNEAMRRPGRIDTILEIKPPNAEAVSRMIKLFARGLLDPTTDLSEASETLAGDIPARIRETVGRAKLESLRRTKDPTALINGADLAFVAKEVKEEAEFFARQGVKADDGGVKALGDGFQAAADAIGRHVPIGNGQAKPGAPVTRVRM